MVNIKNVTGEETRKKGNNNHQLKEQKRKINNNNHRNSNDKIEGACEEKCF